MAVVCAGIKRDGGRCTQSVKAGESFCWNHDPGRQDARRRAASRAGKTRPSREIRQVKDRLLELADDVLGEVVDRGDAIAVAQVLNVYLRACETERRTQDLGDLMSRLEAVEEAASRLRGA